MCTYMLIWQTAIALCKDKAASLMQPVASTAINLSSKALGISVFFEDFVFWTLFGGFCFRLCCLVTDTEHWKHLQG